MRIANRLGSRLDNFAKSDERAVIEEEKKSGSSTLLLAHPPCLSLSLSFFSLTIKVSFYPRYTTYDYLRDRSPQTRNFVLKFLKSGKPPQLIDSAVYSDCRILEDIISRKYPPKTSFAVKCSLFYLLFIFPLYSCVKYNLSDDCKLIYTYI